MAPVHFGTTFIWKIIWFCGTCAFLLNNFGVAEGVHVTHITFRICYMTWYKYCACIWWLWFTVVLRKSLELILWWHFGFQGWLRECSFPPLNLNSHLTFRHLVHSFSLHWQPLWHLVIVHLGLQHLVARALGSRPTVPSISPSWISPQWISPRSCCPRLSSSPCWSGALSPMITIALI